MLPRRKAIPAKRDSRWRSPAHTSWVRGFHCCACGSGVNIAAAHVRLGSHTGMGQKPDDWRTVPLCDGPNADAHAMLGCHNRQHITGEATFWAGSGVDPEKLILELIAASPKRADILRVQKERANG